MGAWLDGLEDRARRRLHPLAFDYIHDGAGDGITAAHAAEAWRRLRLRPQVLRDVTQVDLSTTLLGEEVSVPFGVAPTSLRSVVHPQGDLVMAQACAARGTPLVVSCNTGAPFADLGAAGAPWWLQIYLPAERTLAEPLLESAQAHGARAVVLTVDTPVVGTKHSPSGSVWENVDPGTVRVNFPPGYEERTGSQKATDLGPRDISWLAARTGLPVVVKGVLRADDARRALDAGAAALWVSNHGGRQLDRALPTPTALADVVAELPDAEVYVDGGINRGVDVVCALALGARAAFLGRAPLYALIDGPDGVARWREELEEELVEALMLCGLRRAQDAPTAGLLDRSNRL